MQLVRIGAYYIRDKSLRAIGLESEIEVLLDIRPVLLEELIGASLDEIMDVMMNHKFKKACRMLNIIESQYLIDINEKSCRMPAFMHPQRWGCVTVPTLTELRLAINGIHKRDSPGPFPTVQVGIVDHQAPIPDLKTHAKPSVNYSTLELQELNALGAELIRINLSNRNTSCVDVAVDIVNGDADATHEFALVDSLAPNMLRRMKSWMSVNGRDNVDKIAKFEIIRLAGVRFRNHAGNASVIKTSLSLAIACSHASDNVKELLSSVGISYSPNKQREMLKQVMTIAHL